MCLEPDVRISAVTKIARLNQYGAQDGRDCAPVRMPTDVARRACLISRTSASCLGLPEGVSVAGLLIEQTADLPSAVRALASRRSGCSVVFINFDDFSSESVAIDLLRRLRTRSPNLPVILMSKTFRGDDLSQERLAITDISLVSPIPDIRSIGPALEVAALNNAVWRKRRRSLMLEKARQMN